MKSQLKTIYNLLHREFGPQHWWPGEKAFEVMVGAILTQNTNWGNVEKAINNLKAHNLLSVKKMYETNPNTLADLIRPAGYFRVKTKRLRNFLKFYLDEFQGQVAKMQLQELADLRPKILAVNGIGPETADSMLLYALEKPIFVVDAYTKRILSRHNLLSEEATYNEIQELFMDNLENDVQFFNEYHALLVKCGKQYCRPKNPRCELCPLNTLFSGA
ncbi:MAG: endonuclease III domain-containing protein [Pseudomonadota bacterium]